MPPVLLHQFDVPWVLPNPSPFCLKLETFLRMAGVDYARRPWDPVSAPLGKAPFITLDGERIADSSCAIEALTRRFGLTLDEGLDAARRGQATLLQRTLEEHLYWVIIATRWVDDAGWATYKPVIGATLPRALAPLLLPFIRRKAVTAALAQGLARHPPAEIQARGLADVAAVAEVLGDQPFMLGEAPRSVDATAYAFLAHAAVPLWPSPVQAFVTEHPALSAYLARMKHLFWSDT